MSTITIDAAFRSLPRNEQARRISDAMRAIDPETFDAAAAVVRRNIAILRRVELATYRNGK